MPIKIQNLLTGEIKLIKLKERKDYQSNIWSLVSRKDIFQVYESHLIYPNQRIDRGEHEKEDLEETLMRNPRAFFEAVSDWENWDKIVITEKSLNNQSLEPVRETGNLLPINNPKQYANKTIKAIIKPVKSIFQNDYTKYIITGLVVLILWFFIYPLLKHKFNHP